MMGSGNNCVISHSESIVGQNVLINTGHKAKSRKYTNWSIEIPKCLPRVILTLKCLLNSDARLAKRVIEFNL